MAEVLPDGAHEARSLTPLELSQHAIARLRALAKAGRRTPGGHVRVGEFWFGDGDAVDEGAIVFRQASKAQYKTLGAMDGRSPDEIARVNKSVVAACTLWFPGLIDDGTHEERIARFCEFMDVLEDLYPLIWSELITAWDRHNHGAREDLRGKV